MDESKLMNAEQVCKALSIASVNPVDYCSHLARRGHIDAVRGLRAVYTRESVDRYIDKLVLTARMSRGKKRK